MRTFQIGQGEGRKFVVLEIEGSRLRVTKGDATGPTQRTGKDFADEAEARARAEQMARELIARGFAEKTSRAPSKAEPASSSRKAARAGGSGGLDLGLLAEAGEGDAEPVES